MILRFFFVRPCRRVLVIGVMSDPCHFLQFSHFVRVRHLEVLLESLNFLLEVEVVAVEK